MVQEEEIGVIRDLEDNFKIKRVICVDCDEEKVGPADVSVSKVWIGDADTVGGASRVKGNYDLKVIFSEAKDKSDFELALEIARNLSYFDFESSEWVNNFFVLGAVGGRLDHEMFNLGVVWRLFTGDVVLRDRVSSSRLPSSVQHLKNLHLRVSFLGITDRGRWYALLFFDQKISFYHRGTFSFLALEEVFVRIDGRCRWRYEGYASFFNSLTLSNEASGRVYVSAQKGAIYVEFDDKKGLLEFLRDIK